MKRRADHISRLLMRSRILLACLILMTIPNILSVADESVSPHALVLVIVRPSGMVENALFREVIADSIKFELERAGLQVILSSEPTEVSPVKGVDEAGDIDVNSMLNLARSVEADFVITGEYSSKDNDIQIDFNWYDVSESRLSVSVSKSSRLGLTLDMIIAEAIDDILIQAKDRLANFSTRPKEKTFEGSVQQESEQLPENQAAAKQTIDKQIDADARIIKRFEFSIGFSPFLVNAGASEYFKIGFMPSFYVSYRINMPIGWLGLGIYAGINSFLAEGVLASSECLLIPLGVDLRYATGEGTSIGLFVRISGGPAILTINPNETGRLSKVIPYVLGGIGLNIPFTRSFGIAVDTSYTIFFEKQHPIMGFTPSVYLYMRL